MHTLSFYNVNRTQSTALEQEGLHQSHPHSVTFCWTNNYCPLLKRLSRVPQGSCLGPLLFTLYASKLFEVVKRHLPSVHGYADDTQLYLAFKPGCVSSTEDAVAAMEGCANEIRAWMLCDKLKINDDKTEFVIIGTRQQLSKVHVDSLAVGDAQVSPVQSVKNLGTWIDSNMSLQVNIKTHVKQPITTLQM